MTQNPVAESISPDVLVQSFCVAIAREIGVEPQDYIDDKKSRIFADADALVQSNGDLVIDDASQRYLTISSLILSAFNAFEDDLPSYTKRVEILRGTTSELFERGIRDYIKVRFDVDYDKPREAFDKVTKNFMSRGEQYLGEAFDYSEVKKDEQETTYVVSRCFFLNFFTRNGAPGVTKVMCALDTIWAREFNEGDYDIEFDRPTLMSDGDDKCRFHFVRSTGPTGE